MTNEQFTKEIEMQNARLAHYNAWMARKFAPDSTTDICEVYPGFPGDKPAKAAKAIVAKVQPTAPAKVAKAVKGGVTKLDQAKELFKANAALSRAEMIALFMDKLGMSKAGATTYFYNAQK